MSEEWSWIRRNPVAAFTSALTVILAADAMLLGFGVLNPHQTAMAVSVEGFLTVVLGAVTHKNTTSLVKPKDEDGTPLVPATAVARPDPLGPPWVIRNPDGSLGWTDDPKKRGT